VVKTVSPDGTIEWESPGPASAHVFHADDSTIGIWGKDPSLVKNNPRNQMHSEVYAGLMRQIYLDNPTEVLLLDPSTGATTLRFVIPSSMTPSTFLGNSSLTENMMVFALERDHDVITGYGLYYCSDGHAIASVDLVRLLPKAIIRDLEPRSGGLVAFAEDGSVSVLTLQGELLWSKDLLGRAGQ